MANGDSYPNARANGDSYGDAYAYAYPDAHLGSNADGDSASANVSPLRRL